jgi:hypothetical protein
VIEETPRPKFSCAVCGRLDTIVMGDRGPVRTALAFTEIGHFRFCDECFANAEVGGRTHGGLFETTLTMVRGDWRGHTWITSADYR